MKKTLFLNSKQEPDQHVWMMFAYIVHGVGWHRVGGYAKIAPRGAELWRAHLEGGRDDENFDNGLGDGWFAGAMRCGMGGRGD